MKLKANENLLNFRYNWPSWENFGRNPESIEGQQKLYFCLRNYRHSLVLSVLYFMRLHDVNNFTTLILYFFNQIIVNKN